MSLMRYTKNNPAMHHLKRMYYLMGTFLSIEVFHQDKDKTVRAIEAAFNEVRRIERLLSRFREDSSVYKINNLAYYKPQTIDTELFCLISDCLEFSDRSGGAFDITEAPLVDLWSQAEKSDSLPTHKEIRSILSEIGYKNIILDIESKTITFKAASLKIDLGAAGKGYALDKVLEVLKEEGIDKTRLNFGGHLYYFDRPEAEEECIGIRNPLQPEEIMVSLPLKNKSISTSANYERNFKIQNRIYGHLINPVTGYPADSGILSVSVISDCAMDSDILSTAIFILGLENGLKLIRDFADAEAIIITDNDGEPKIHSFRKPEEVMCGL